jgi:hypothetical protein
LFEDTRGCASFFHAPAPFCVNFKFNVATNDPAATVFSTTDQSGNQSPIEWLDQICTKAEKCHFRGD